MSDQADETIDIQFNVYASGALATSKELRAEVDRLKAQLRDLVDQSRGTGVAISDVFKSALDQAKTNLAQAQAANGGNGGDDLSTPETEAAVKQATLSVRAMEQAIVDLNSEYKVGRSEATSYAESIAQLGTTATKTQLAENKLTEEIKAQYREQAKSAGLTPKQFTSQFVEQFKATPIPGMDIEQATKAATRAASELTTEERKEAQAIDAANKSMKEQATTMKSTNAVVQDGTKSVGLFGSGLSGLGSIARLVFGGSLAIVAVNALRNVIQFLKEATEAGIEFEKALIRLNVSTNILRQNGLNVTMQDTLDTVNKLNVAFPIFTKKSIVEGVGYVQLLSANLNLTNEQMQNLERVSASIAVVMGKDFNDAAREVALFLSSGYGEALQKTGILASKAAVSHELLRMGIRESYNDVDAQTRALAGYNVIMEQAAGITEKATEIQKENAYAGDRLTTAFNNLKNTIGEGTAPSFLTLANIISYFVQGADDLVKVLTYVSAVLHAGFTAALLGSARAANALTTILYHVGDASFNAADELKQAGKDIIKIFEDTKQAALETFLPDYFGKFAEDAVGASQSLQEAFDKMVTAAQEMYTQIKDLQKQFMQESVDLWQKYQDDAAKIDADGYQKRAELAAKYITDLAQINLKADQDIVDANLKYARDVADADHDFQVKRAEAERKYRDNELKAERDFQEKMRRLREDFILNLEDAVRERDALQVIRLTRQYNIDRGRLLRDAANEKEDRKKAFAAETRDAEQQRNERMRQLRIELDRRIADINANRAREIQAREMQYKREQIDLEIALKKQKEARMAQYAKDAEALDEAQHDRLVKIAKDWAQQYTTNREGAMKIYGLMVGIFGPSGTLDTLFSNYIFNIEQKSHDMVGQLIADTLLMQAYFQNLQAGMIGTQPGTFDPKATEQASTASGGMFSPIIMDLLHRLGVPGFATGGTMIATKPTPVIFGERGAEMATFTPMGSNHPSSGGSVKIQLDLSPDLEARIVDSSLDQMAEVILSVGNRR